MTIIYTENFKNELEKELISTTNNIHIISAFCKKNIIAFIDSKLSSSVKSKKLLVRFTLRDIISKATDFGLYEYCLENNWEMFVNFDIHAKTFIF